MQNGSGGGSSPQGKPAYGNNPRVYWGESGKGRVSQGAGQVLLGKGGLGYIARRGVDFGTSVGVQTLEGVARLAVQQPLELLSLLPDLVPEVGLALWNGTFLGCGPESLRIKAVTKKPEGGSEEAPDGTAAIKDLWEKQPAEVGGLIDALGQNYQMLLFSGLCAAEAVPGARNTGLSGVFPVNTLTLRFKREDDGSLALYQRQTANPNGLGLYSAGFGGLFEPMPMNRFFYSRLPALPDEPYGRAPFGAALTIVLETLAFWRDVMLAFHRIGTPKWDVSFDFEMWGKIARDVVGLTDPYEINNYIQSKYQAAINFFNGLSSDDVFFHGLNDKVNAVGSGDSWPDLGEIWSMLRLRLVQALKQLPSLMGIAEGSSETWSKLEFEIYASSLRTLVSKAAGPLVQASQLHLQLLGMPYTAEPEFKELRSITRMIDAQALQIEIANQIAMVAQNWQLNSTAAMEITGSAPPTPEEIASDTPPKVPALPVTVVEDPIPPGGGNQPGQSPADQHEKQADTPEKKENKP
jgi:hypothetical protein